MRPTRFALAFSAFVVSCGVSAFGCGGIDEPDLFGPIGSAQSDAGGDARSDARTGSDAGKKDGGVGGDAGKPPPLGSVQCTSGDCSISDNQVCCYDAAKTGTCTAAGSCSGAGAFPIPCDSAQDCADEGQPGTVCCAQADQTGAVTNVECVDPSNCQSANGQTNLCDPNAPDPCPNGGTCSASTVSIPGYDICKM